MPQASLPSPTEIQAIGLAWARVMPVVAIVPGFGLKALPTPARGILALAIAAGIYPALLPIVHAREGVPWVVSALEQTLAGLPIALAAAVPLWAATMAGGLVDSLRGAQDAAGSPAVEGRASSFGILLSLFASAAFLATGGASRVAAALAAFQPTENPILAVANDLTSGITLAVAIGGPLLAAAVVLEITFALVARASSPAQIHALLAPIRALGLLAIVAIVLERIGALLAAAARAKP
ncbi:MAG TPA: flagellar biosynthetic protein FliR [Labilithrix sp.]|jgi:type III secretory pathway component EscT